MGVTIFHEDKKAVIYSLLETAKKDGSHIVIHTKEVHSVGEDFEAANHDCLLNPYSILPGFSGIIVCDGLSIEETYFWQEKAVKFKTPFAGIIYA